MSGLSKLGIDVSSIYARATADGQKVFAVCFYAFASVSMTLVNKGAVKAIPFPYFLCLIQNALTVVIALFVALVLAPGHEKLGLKLQITKAVLITWMPALILFVLMLTSSMSAMKYLAVPSVLVFRALTPLATAAFAMCLLENSIPSKAEWASLAVIVVGAACYLAADPSFSLYGYAWMLLNLFAAALYHVYVKRCINKLTPSTMDLVLLNNVLSIPIFLLLGATIDDPVGLVQQLQHVSLGGWLAVLGSCIVAGLIAFSGLVTLAQAVDAMSDGDFMPEQLFGRFHNDHQGQICYACVADEWVVLVGTKVGYCQGEAQEPSYEQVCTGTTGHTEGLQITYDPEKISYEALCDKLLSTVDSTAKNRVGNDRGPQYRHGLYYHTAQQEAAARRALAREQSKQNKPVVTELKPAAVFWPAENYHRAMHPRIEPLAPPWHTLTAAIRVLGFLGDRALFAKGRTVCRERCRGASPLLRLKCTGHAASTYSCQMQTMGSNE